MVTIAPCFANDVKATIQPLEISIEDIQDIWHSGRCEESWSINIDKEILEDTSLLAYKGLNGKFFRDENYGKEITLKAGEKCEALNKYYFQGIKNPKIITFINLDEKFIRKYGFSVLDAIYIKNTEFYSWNGTVSNFMYKYAKELVRKGLFTMEQKNSEFNGKPSVSFSGTITVIGKKFHEKVYQ